MDLNVTPVDTIPPINPIAKDSSVFFHKVDFSVRARVIESNGNVDTIVTTPVIPRLENNDRMIGYSNPDTSSNVMAIFCVLPNTGERSSLFKIVSFSSQINPTKSFFAYLVQDGFIKLSIFSSDHEEGAIYFPARYFDVLIE